MEPKRHKPINKMTVVSDEEENIIQSTSYTSSSTSTDAVFIEGEVDKSTLRDKLDMFLEKRSDNVKEFVLKQTEDQVGALTYLLSDLAKLQASNETLQRRLSDLHEEESRLDGIFEHVNQVQNLSYEDISINDNDDKNLLFLSIIDIFNLLPKESSLPCDIDSISTLVRQIKRCIPTTPVASQEGSNQLVRHINQILKNYETNSFNNKHP